MDLGVLAVRLLKLSLDDVIFSPLVVALAVPGIFCLLFPQSFNDCLQKGSGLDWPAPQHMVGTHPGIVCYHLRARHLESNI